MAHQFYQKAQMAGLPFASTQIKQFTHIKKINILITKNNNYNLITLCESCIQILSLSSFSFQTKFEDFFFGF